jgi:predicted transcriptional regulator of viral defense system
LPIWYGIGVPGPTQDLRRQLQELAFRQSGYFTAAQAVRIGYSYQAQKYHADHGNWIRVDRGLFRLPSWPSSSDDSYVRWSLWSGGRGVISHDSALAVHDLSDASPTRIHLTVPRDFRATDDAVVTHPWFLDDHDVESRGSWRVTTVERTLADIAGDELSQEIVDAAVSEALNRGQTTRRRLLRQAEGVCDHAALRLERALAARAAT